MAQGGNGAEQRQSRLSGFSGIPTLGEATPGCRDLDSSELQLCVWSRIRLSYSVLKVTSDIWPEGLEGQLSWAGTRRDLGLQAVV